MRTTKKPESASPEKAKVKYDDTGIVAPIKGVKRRRPPAARKRSAPVRGKR